MDLANRGAAELLQALTIQSNFCAVVAESPFASLKEITFDRMDERLDSIPWLKTWSVSPAVQFAFIYGRLAYNLNLDKVSPVRAVVSTRVPVLLIHGLADHNISIRHLRLIQAANPIVERWEVPGAAHCGALTTAPQDFEQRVVGWFSQHDDRSALVVPAQR